MKSKLFILFLALVISVGIVYASVTIDGINYNLNDNELTAEVTFGINYSGNIVIPASVTYNSKTYSVTSIGSYAFKGCSSMTSVSIPNSVTSIGSHAFRGCSSLTSITIPNSVTSIGSDAFSNCSSLPIIDNIRYADTYLIGAVDKSLSVCTIKESTRWIASDAFTGCSSLTSVTIPNSVTSIGWYAFKNCSSLTSVTIPNSVTSIGLHAFENCSSLPIADNIRYADTYLIEAVDKSLCVYTIKESTRWIDFDAFQGCSNMTAVTIPNSVTSIGAYAFSDCSSLTSITIPVSLVYFGNYVFYRTPLTSVVWNARNCPDFDSRITPFCNIDNAWDMRNQITSFTFGDNVEHIPAYLCSGMSNITDIVIPNSVTSIGEGAFSGCHNATSAITIPNSVTSIGAQTFYGCNSLKSILLGTSVKVLEEYAFYNCSSIETITCYSMRPPTVNNNAFYNLPYSTIVYVPSDYLNTYKMHDAWGLYDVRPLGATSVQITDLQITPDDNTANVVWPTVENAATYEMIIKDKNGVIVCTLIFNANGQLTSIAFAAPGRSPASTQSAGFSFTVTGLDGATLYDLTMTAKDNSGNILQTTTKSFATNGYTGIDNVESSAMLGGQKILRDGQLLILRDGKTYTVQGQEVR